MANRYLKATPLFGAAAPPFSNKKATPFLTYF
jgi:hypothetical protein